MSGRIKSCVWSLICAKNITSVLPPHSTILLQYSFPLSPSSAFYPSFHFRIRPRPHSLSALTSAFDLVRIRSRLQRPHSLSASTSAFDLRPRPHSLLLRPHSLSAQLQPPYSTIDIIDYVVYNIYDSTPSSFALSFYLEHFRSRRLQRPLSLRCQHSTAASTGTLTQNSAEFSLTFLKKTFWMC